MQSYRPNAVLSTAQGLWEALQQYVTEQRPSLGGPMQHGRPLALDEHKLVVRDHRVATRSRRRPWRSVPLSSSIFLWTQSHISTIKLTFRANENRFLRIT